MTPRDTVRTGVLCSDSVQVLCGSEIRGGRPCWSRTRFRRYSGSTSWGGDSKRIARQLGISRNTVKDYVAAGGWTPYRQPQRKKALDGQETWLKERLRQHHGNADVIRQELAAEKGIIVSLRTVERAVQRYRQELAAEARATVRFETTGEAPIESFGRAEAHAPSDQLRREVRPHASIEICSALI